MYTVYSSDNCPFCVKLKNFMDMKGVTYKVVDVKEDELALAYLRSSGYRTIPQVFSSDGEHVGDCDSFINGYGLESLSNFEL